MYLLIIGSLVVTIIIDSLLWVHLYSQRRRDTLMAFLLVHVFSILVWAFGILYTINLCSGDSLACPPIVAQIPFAAAFAMAVSKYYFVREFTKRESTSRSWLEEHWIVIPAALVFAGSFVPDLYYETPNVIDGFYIDAQPGSAAGVYMLAIMYFLIHPIVRLSLCARDNYFSERARSQMRLLLFGITVFFAASLTTNLILPLVFNIYFFNGLGPSFSLVLAALIWYTIYKYNFLEVRVLIQRGLVFTLSWAIVLAIYLTFVHLFAIAMQMSGMTSNTAAAALTTLIGLWGVPRLNNFFRKVTNPIFFKHQYNYFDTLYDFSEQLSATFQLEEVIDYATGAFERTFGAVGCTIDVTKKGVPYVSRTELQLPLLTKTGTHGTLHLGPKRSGDPYTKQDVQLISTITHHIAVAVERSTLYSKVQSYAYELEDKVAERTRKIEELQSYQKTMLDEISHGLQTPLTIIKNELEQFRERGASASFIAPFERSIESLSTFVTQLLRLSRFEASESLREPQIIDLSDLLQTTIEYCSISVEANDVTFRSDIAPNILIHGYRAELEEAIVILFHNAAKYRDPDRPQIITVTMQHVNNVVTIGIHDIGLGIASQHLPQVFDRFYRIRDGKHQQTTGTGLGLAICKTVIEKHGGTIVLDSVHGSYTEFTITLPYPQS